MMVGATCFAERAFIEATFPFVLLVNCTEVVYCRTAAQRWEIFSAHYAHMVWALCEYPPRDNEGRLTTESWAEIKANCNDCRKVRA